MLDEGVEERKLLLQIGGLSVREVYKFDGPVLAELHSPPRLAQHARQKGIGDGLALDLTTANGEGRPWDFSKPDCRTRASRKIADLSYCLGVHRADCIPHYHS